MKTIFVKTTRQPDNKLAVHVENLINGKVATKIISDLSLLSKTVAELKGEVK